MSSPKLFRITTVPLSLEKLISGQMRFMKTCGFQVHMVSSEAQNKEDLEQREDCTFLVLNMTRTISPVKDLLSLIKMVLLLRKFKPDIVHTHTPKAGLIGMLASWIAGVPIRLHTVAGLPLMETKGFKRKLLESVEKITYASATYVYPNSNKLKDFILSANFTRPTKLKVIGNGSSNGINVSTFSRTSEITKLGDELLKLHKLSSHNFIYVFVGRLVKDKGIEELVEAFAILSKKHPLLKLLLVGPQEPALDPLSKECLKEIGLNESIISVGYQKDVRSYLSISSALVFPSYREGFPNVPMQAGCYDLPSIVTNINGCNEIIENGVNGLIISPKSTQELLLAMLRLYEDSGLHNAMKNNARRMIVERYEQNKIWQLILQEYKTHLNNNVNV